jgi:hypothetical protein
MTEGGSGKAEECVWSGLLAETRQALANLRAEDLEELAEHAERMLRSMRAWELARRGGLELRATARRRSMREHKLLGELLQATDSNIAVLRRLCTGGVDRVGAARESARWAR